MAANPSDQSFAGQQQPQEPLDQPQEGGHQREDQGEWGYEHLDPNYGRPEYAFGQPGWLNYHKAVIGMNGYELIRCIAQEPDKYDNQVWIIKEIDNEQHYAFKVCSLHYYRRDMFDQSVDAMYKETDTLNQLSHDNIIRFIESFELEDPNTRFPYGFLCSVLELMDGHLLKLQAEYPHQVFTEERAKDWFRQIANAVDYIHNGLNNKWLSHLAIRPVNILYRKINAELDQYVYKLTDFEESLIFENESADAMPEWNKYRANAWTAPEAYPYRYYGPTKPMDIFSLGQTLLTTLTGPRREGHALYFRVVSGELPIRALHPMLQDIFSVLSPEVGNLLLKCVSKEVADRPTIQMILIDRWLEI